MASKRPNGTGSVYQRGDGRWIAAVNVGRKRVVKYAASQTLALNLLAEMQVSRSSGTLAPPSGLTLSQWVSNWLDIKADHIRPSTLQTYAGNLRMITEILGSLRIENLTPLTLTQAFVLLRNDGRGKRQIQLAHTCLRTCLKDAYELNLINSNPMDRVRKPAASRRRRRYWSIDEARRFIEISLSSGRQWGPLYAFLTTSGLRISEAIALTWNDVNLTKNEVEVSKAMIWVNKTPETYPTKTKAGLRYVSLAASARQALELVRSQESQTTRVFKTLAGTVPHPGNLRRPLMQMCDLAGVEYVNLHGLRHVAAMLTLEATGDAYMVQRRLGHTNITTTLSLYGYSARSDSSVAIALDELLGETNGTKGSSAPRPASFSQRSGWQLE